MQPLSLSLKHLCMAVFITIASVAVPSRAADNLLANPGFEVWTTRALESARILESADTGPPTGWQFLVGQNPNVIRRDVTTHHSGEASLRVDLKLPDNTGWIGQRVENIHPDTEYRVSGQIKVAPGSRLQLPLNVEPNLGGKDLPAASGWTAWEWTFNSREATEVMVQFRLRGEGTVWLDSLSLLQVGETGASVLPERVELLKLLAYQSRPVSPESNTEEWTRPLRSAADPLKAFAKKGGTGFPTWKVGQWARYLCHDDLLVPSRVPEKRPLVTVMDCAIVGRERIEGKTYWWYQCVVRLNKYWVAKAQGKYDSGQKILLARPRKVVISLLIEGPEFKDVRRYQLKVDGEPLLEYTDGERAVLPALTIDHALLKPRRPPVDSSGPGGTFNSLRTRESAVPVTGVLAFESHSPHLDRTAKLINWGNAGAKDERSRESPFVLKLARPPYVAVSFDGFGELRHYEEMLKAGADWFQQLTVLYLGEARAYFNRMPAYFSNSRAWDVDVFDVCRSNFAGFAPLLDEPYQRQRKPNEFIKRREVNTLPEAAEKYSGAIRGLVEKACWWPGQTVPDYNSPASAAWYSARAGASGFILEQARLISDLETIKRVTEKDDARALSDELNIACMAGAARRFGTWWGEGIYRWVPDRYWKDSMVRFAERGAQYLGFWIEGGEAMKDPNLSFYQQVLKSLPDLVSAVKNAKPKPRKASTVLLIPNGYVLGLAGSAAETPWGILDFPEGKPLTEAVIAKASDLMDRGITFDIAVEDPDHPTPPDDYEQVIRFPTHN